MPLKGSSSGRYAVFPALPQQYGGLDRVHEHSHVRRPASAAPRRAARHLPEDRVPHLSAALSNQQLTQ
ncbi:uncharacterized protein V6R79_017711 [Siganus canaliculatus]